MTTKLISKCAPRKLNCHASGVLPPSQHTKYLLGGGIHPSRAGKNLPIPRSRWAKKLGKLLENLISSFLTQNGVPCWVRVKASKGDIDIIVIDLLRKIIFLIEIRNLSGEYSQDGDIEELIDKKFKRNKEWIEKRIGKGNGFKVKKILVISKLNCKKTVKKQLKVHGIRIVETGKQVIPDEFRGQLSSIFEGLMDIGLVDRTFESKCDIYPILASKLYPLIVPNQWDKTRMFDGLSKGMTFEEAVESLNFADFAHLIPYVNDGSVQSRPYFITDSCPEMPSNVCLSSEKEKMEPVKQPPDSSKINCCASYRHTGIS